MMDDRERRIRQRLKDDFPHYARKCLKIRAKTPVIIDGVPRKIIPFELNRAQIYLHEKLEEQKAATGRVRALLLKGRQQGCCLTPDTMVLKSDYSWTPIDDIHPGDTIISVDEDNGGTTVVGRKTERRFRKAEVEFRSEFIADVSAVALSNGTVLKSTNNHRWLVQQRGGCCTLWRETGQLRVGDHIRAAVHAPEPGWAPTWLDGWVGGILDADGSCAMTAAARVAFSQVDNIILQKYKKYLRANNIKFYEIVDNRTKVGKHTKLGDDPVHCVRVDSFPDIAKLLSKTGPCRFDIQHTFEGRKLPKTSEAFEAWPEVLSIRSVGPQRVIDLQTSTKTFIAEGMVSHNSTYVGGRFYHKTTFRRGVKTFILAHLEDATSNLFRMVQRFHEHCPGPVRASTSFSNRRELVFDKLDSAYGLGTAGSKNVGRSDTIDYLHGSEVAFFEHTAEIKTGVFQAAESAEEIILESTAYGLGDMFHRMWQDAESGRGDYIAVFIPWYWQDEYRKAVPEGTTFDQDELDYQAAYGLDDEQLYWRRMKVIDLGDLTLFKQEYPATASEAFQVTGHDALIRPETVLRSRKAEAERYGAYVVGCDPAREGDDLTTFIRRQGRKAWNLEKFSQLDDMAKAGKARLILDGEPVDRMFIDRGGGSGMYDRLVEMGYGHRVRLVNFGSAAMNPQRYKNRRAEMWGEMKLWLESDEITEIPDEDYLQADLVAPGYKYTSLTQLQLEKKEDIKRRTGKSPDGGDALALTFAEPVQVDAAWQYEEERDYESQHDVVDSVTGY